MVWWEEHRKRCDEAAQHLAEMRGESTGRRIALELARMPTAREEFIAWENDGAPPYETWKRHFDAAFAVIPVELRGTRTPKRAPPPLAGPAKAFARALIGTCTLLVLVARPAHADGKTYPQDPPRSPCETAEKKHTCPKGEISICLPRGGLCECDCFKPSPGPSREDWPDSDSTRPG